MKEHEYDEHIINRTCTEYLSTCCFDSRLQCIEYNMHGTTCRVQLDAQVYISCTPLLPYDACIDVWSPDFMLEIRCILF